MAYTGLSQRAFALEHGWPVRQAGYWIRKLRDGVGAQTPELVPVAVKSDNVTEAAVSPHRVGGRHEPAIDGSEYRRGAGRHRPARQRQTQWLGTPALADPNRRKTPLLPAQRDRSLLSFAKSSTPQD